MSFQFLDLNNEKKEEIPKPIGFQKKIQQFDEDQFQDRRGMLLNKAWGMATSPASGFFMYFIMFYFFGNSINIYTLIMMSSVVITHLKNITSIGQKFAIFKPYNLQELSFYKFIYFLINLGILCFLAYKFYNMGLIPLSPADYIDVLPINTHQEKIIYYE